MDSTNRIIYLQGFYQAYGMNKLAMVFPRGAAAPAANATGAGAFDIKKLDWSNLEDPTKPFNFTDSGGKLEGYRKNFPKELRWMGEAYTGPQGWWGKVKRGASRVAPSGIKQWAEDWTTGELMREINAGNFEKAKELWKTNLKARTYMANYANQQRAALVARQKENWKNRGQGAVAGLAGAAAIAIPAVMGMFQNSSASSNAASSDPASNTIDPRVEELRKHVAARQPGAVFRLSEESTPGSTARNRASGMASSLYERLMQRYKNPKDSVYPADIGQGDA